MTTVTENIALRRPDGLVFAAFTRDRANGWIYAQWSGILTLDLIKQAATAFNDLLAEEPCAKLLNDHREVVGRFTEANDWLATESTPRSMALGLRYFAHVLSPGLFGQLSMKELQQRIGDGYEMRLFGQLADAEEWLRRK